MSAGAVQLLSVHALEQLSTGQANAAGLVSMEETQKRKEAELERNVTSFSGALLVGKSDPTCT